MDEFPPGFEEDERQRSHFIRRMTLRQLEREQACLTSGAAEDCAGAIPRTLVQFWHDRHNVPADVRKCLASWQVLRAEGFEFRMFDDGSAAAYVAQRFGAREVAAFERCRHPAMRSDYLRLCFVLDEGGLYVDADDVLNDDGWRCAFRNSALKVQPLCYDVTAGGDAASDRASAT